jgi:hypothetical protein
LGIKGFNIYDNHLKVATRKRQKNTAIQGKKFTDAVHQPKRNIMKQLQTTILCCAALISGCASIDRPIVTYKDSPNDQTKERVYAWTPGTAAAIGVDQYGDTDEMGKPKKDAVKFCVLTAASARTAALSANAVIEAPTAKGGKIEAGMQQNYGAIILKNESAAATFLDIGMFHICMFRVNVGGIGNQDVKELAVELFKSAVEVSKSSLQWAPLPDSKPAAAPAPAPAASK